MSIKDSLRETIDRLVEDAIRRILPTVMNEVLIRAIASSGALSEEVARPRRRPGPKPKARKPKPVRERREVRVVRPPPVRRDQNLRDLLDESAGAEFYGGGDDPPAVEERTISSRMSALPPQLRALAEDVVVPEGMEDDEEWDGRGDSNGPTAVPSSVPDIGRAAAATGIDFSRMMETIKKTSAAPRASQDDARAREQFEARRLKALRERLNDGKPVE